MTRVTGAILQGSGCWRVRAFRARPIATVVLLPAAILAIGWFLVRP